MMSLYQLTVTTTDISQLQQGILFTTTNAGDISAQVSAINANAPNAASQTVTSYANQLLATGLSSSQVMMGVSALMTGASPVDCDADQLRDEPGLIPSFASFAVTNKLDVTQVVGEDIGLAFAGNTSFVGQLRRPEHSGICVNDVGSHWHQSGIYHRARCNFSSTSTRPLAFPEIPRQPRRRFRPLPMVLCLDFDVALNLEGTGGTQATTNQTLVKNALFDIAQTASSPPGSDLCGGCSRSPRSQSRFPFQGGRVPPHTTSSSHGVDTRQGFSTSYGSPERVHSNCE